MQFTTQGNRLDRRQVACRSYSCWWGRTTLLIHLVFGLLSMPCSSAFSQDGESRKHPWPSYEHLSDREIASVADAVRKSRPQMFRGGWEWDRLLSRYVDGRRERANELLILRAYFLSILDRYNEALAKNEPFSLFPGHRSWGSGGRIRIFAELKRQGLLTVQQRNAFRRLVADSFRADFSDYAAIERGVNNRPYGINAGPALALRQFPGLSAAKRHERWIDALWREFTEYGDTTETNYYPYGPLYLHALIDIAEARGAFDNETERKLLYAHARRYLDYVHGGGVRGNPNSGATVVGDRKSIYSDPWNAEYYAGAETVNDGHVWYRLAKHFRDPEFLWASEQVLLGGRPPTNRKTPADYMAAYKTRYDWFQRRGIAPRVPASRSKIGVYSPLKYRVPERLYLCPGRESGQPFASFYIYDRNNNYMHYCDDADGRLYEYCFDGAKFLHTSGKYSSGRAGVADTAYDMLSVLPLDMAFPVDKTGKMSAAMPNVWKLASMAIKRVLNCRNGPDSKSWVYDETVKLFRRTDDPTVGYAHGNMDGYWYLNNDYHLRSVTLGPFDANTAIQNLRLSGPAGETILVPFSKIPARLTVNISHGEEWRTVPRNEWASLLSILPQGRREGASLQVTVPDGATVSLTVTGLDVRFDGQNEFTRLSYDVRGPSADMTLNERTHPYYYNALYNRGAILVRDSVQAENTGDDSFGQFTFRNYYGGRSRWTRQTVLTSEGILVVRDVYQPGVDVDGYHAGPCWMLTAPPTARRKPAPADAPPVDRNWFDAPARDHAWWQTRRKRVLLFMHPVDGQEIGSTVHRASQDIGGGPIQNCFSKRIVRAGEAYTWLSVLVPFNEGDDASGVAATIQTAVDANGNAQATIGPIAVDITSSGEWSVTRDK